MLTINELAIIDLPNFPEDGASLTVIEGSTNIPFAISRVFTVNAVNNQHRGRHAHKLCNQLLICSVGACQVLCDDGTTQRKILLDNHQQGLLIPASIWAEQRYLHSPTVLLVLCDQPFDQTDYIRDYQKFLSYRSKLT